VVWRYDALATLLSVVALVFVALRMPIASGVSLGAAIMAKLYPLAMLPVLMFGQAGTRGGVRRAIVLAVATVASTLLIFAPFFVDSGFNSFSFLSYAVNRGVQIESVPGALALLVGTWSGHHPRIFNGFGTWQVDSPVVPFLGSFWSLLTLVMLAALGIGILYRFVTERSSETGLTRTTQVHYLVAALMVVLISARIISPQYLFWVAPFVALTSRPKTLVFWVACVVTTFVYPINYQQLLNQETYAVVAINIRNLILIGFLVMLLAGDVRLAIVEFVPRARALARRSRTSSPAA
jgi:uncharacterized membrane protein